MTRMNTKLTSAVESYFAGIRQVSASGGATGELSRYTPLVNLLNAVGGTLKPEEVQHFTDTARRIGAILVATASKVP